MTSFEKSIRAVLGTAVLLPLAQCVMVDENGNLVEEPAIRPSADAPAHGPSLTATSGAGSVTIRQGGRVLATLRTASPNVEETHWHGGQERIAVKSRGNHGPATLELFESRSGRKLGTVMHIKPPTARSGPVAWRSEVARFWFSSTFEIMCRSFASLIYGAALVSTVAADETVTKRVEFKKGSDHTISM